MAKRGLAKYGINPEFNERPEPVNVPDQTPPVEQAHAEQPAAGEHAPTQPATPSPVLTPVIEPVEEAKEEKVEVWSPVFGSRKNKKDIAKLAGIGFLFAGVVTAFLANGEQGMTTGRMAFAVGLACIYGGLIGMLLGQLIFVYPQAVMIVFTAMTILIGEGAVYATGAYEPSQDALNPLVLLAKTPRQIFQTVLGVAFLAGFVGFWLGYVFYARHQNARKRVQERLQQRGSDNL